MRMWVYASEAFERWEHLNIKEYEWKQWLGGKEIDFNITIFIVSNFSIIYLTAGKSSMNIFYFHSTFVNRGKSTIVLID